MLLNKKCCFYFQPIHYINVSLSVGLFCINYVASRPCKLTLPSGASVEFASQMFKHGFHPPAAGNLLLVLNVTSTYDWSDLNFTHCCTVALNYDQAVGCDYNLRTVVIFKYRTNGFGYCVLQDGEKKNQAMLKRHTLSAVDAISL